MRVALADAGDVDRLGAHRLRALRGRHQERGGAVGDQRAVHPVEGRRDPAVVHDVLDGDHVAQHRVPLQGRVLGLGRHDRRQGLLGHVVLVHVALGEQAVATDRGEAEGGLVGAVAHLAGHGDHPRGADARAGVVTAHAQHDLGQAGVDRKSGLHRHQRGGGAADRDRGEVAGLHAQVVRERGRVHQGQLDEGEGGDHAVHFGQRDAGVVEGDLGDLGEELERPASLELPLLGLPHSGDHDALAEHSPCLAQIGRGLAHPSSSWSAVGADRGHRRPTAARATRGIAGPRPGRVARTAWNATSGTS